MINSFNDLKIEVKNQLTIYQVLNWYGVSLNRYGKGRCVIHNSQGSECFYVNPRTQRYTCYSCGKSGDALSFIGEMENTDFIGSVYLAGVQLGLISQEEANNRRIDVKKQNNLKPTVITKKVESILPPAKMDEMPLTEEEIERNHLVYQALAFNCGLEDKDRDELVNERKIREDKVNDYFTITASCSSLMTKVEYFCRTQYGIYKEDIAKVPGFYLNDKGYLQLNNKMKTIAIKIKDSQGRIRMIQLKNRFAKEGDCKYYYLSSNSVNGNKAKMWVDVLYPNFRTYSQLDTRELLNKALATVIITEGKFKAETIADTFNCPVIAIPGIKTFENKVKEEVLNLNKMKQMKNLMIMLDADMDTNIAVGESVLQMLEKELNGVDFNNIFVVVWDSQFGKGADDVILSGNKSSFVKVKGNDFIASYKQFIEDTRNCNRNDEDDKNYMKFLFKKYVIEGEIKDEAC